MNIISDIHTYLRSRPGGPENKEYYLSIKKYPRMPQITLIEPTPLSIPLSDALEKRRSNREFRKTLSLEALSALLGHSLKIRADKHRPHPSGGSLFPLEAYLLAPHIENLPHGVFHYRPDTHALEHLWDLPEHFKMQHINTQGLFAGAAAVILFTAVWERSAQKYKDFAYNLALLEAGHIAQNIQLVSTSLDVHTRPIGGFNDAVVINLLDIAPRYEQPIYGVALG